MTPRENEGARRTFAIIGTGAIGGYYGALLARSGYEVHFLLHRDYDHVRKQGLRVDSINGDFVLPAVNAHANPATMPACDVLLVALKTTQNALLSEIIPQLLKPDGVIIILQNGLGTEETVSSFVGNHVIMGGLCFICSNKIGPGHIHHLDYGQITLGQYTPNLTGAGITEYIKEMANDFNHAGIEVHLTENLAQARWKKLVWNIPFNGLSVVLNATTDQLITSSPSRALAVELMNETLRGAAACGISIKETFVHRMIESTEVMPPYRTSMKIDFDEKRPLEIESIYGNPLRAAAHAGLQLPYMAMLYNQLRFLDERNRTV